MSTLVFTIPGEARGKGRPRFGGGRTYTDDKTASYEGLIKSEAAIAMRGRSPLAGALSLLVVARLIPAPSQSAKRRAAMLAGEIAPTKRPDLDNIVKAVLDGCNKIAFGDDAQVVLISAQKRYAETAGVDVRIEPLGVSA